MEYNATNADFQAMKIIELLIQAGHYKAFIADEVIGQIGKDANALTAALTSSAYKRT